MNALAVTASAKGDSALLAAAQAAADAWKLPFVARGPKEPLTVLLQSAQAVLVFGANGVTLWDRQGSLRWSPGLAALRLGRLEAGHTDDTLVRVAQLRPGDQVLDCTLGLAQDALVAARAVGPGGQVVGLEKSLPIWAVVSEGLRRHAWGPRSARIAALHEDAAIFLTRQGEGTFDVVLFDPMFERTRPSSGSFEAMRRFADYAPLTRPMLDCARHVARRSVIVKGARYSKDLSKLGLSPLPAPGHATVQWARI